MKESVNNKLTQEQVVLTYEWLKDNSKRLESERQSIKGIANQAMSALGFVVTDRNIEYFLDRGMVKIELPRSNGNHSLFQLASEVNSLKANVSNINGAIQSLSDSVTNLLNANKILREEINDLHRRINLNKEELAHHLKQPHMKGGLGR